MASEIHVDDVGTKFLITIKEDSAIVDISSATALSIFIKKPNDTVLARVGTLHTDGTDGKMYYDIAAGDLDEAGQYKLQGRVSIGTSTYYTDVYHFRVHCNI